MKRGLKISPTAHARFWGKVEKSDGCWAWKGYVSKKGYGTFYIDNVRGTCGAHRYSLKASGINIPKGLVVDHTCRNRACVRPDHLRVVTPRVNVLENSNSPSALNAKKTHCPKGHPLSGDNLIRNGGERLCRACRQECGRRTYARLYARERKPRPYGPRTQPYKCVGKAKVACKYGHPKTPENIGYGYQCLPCRREKRSHK
jgi:hypothetical protein